MSGPSSEPEILTATMHSQAMHFDDRLATVLRHRAAGDRAARTQFRQLLDLLGGRRTNSGGGRDESLLAAAWLRLAALGEVIPASERAKMIRDPGLHFHNPELAIHLAEDEPEVASAALARADLDADDWEALIPRLPVRARGFLRHRRDLPDRAEMVLDQLGIHDRALPQPPAVHPDATDIVSTGTVENVDHATSQAGSATSERLPANDPGIGDDDVETDDSLEEDTAIGALVKRIEAFRAARSDPDPGRDAPRLPLGEEVDDQAARPIDSFGFAADQQGRIGWAEPQVAPMVFGTLLDRATFGAAFRFRQPIRNQRTTLAGAPAIAGDWIVDADPRFTDPDGRFFGYAGKFRRAPKETSGSDDSQQSSEADRLRQLLHELRTPVNAIQGFSEVIQQQLFGPTPNEYRALAANIAGDSARMLAGFDELDRLAKLETGAIEPEPGESDFASIVRVQLEHLEPTLRQRTSGFRSETVESSLVPMELGEAENLSWRLLATLAGAIGAGEWLQLELAKHGGALRLCCELPASIAAEPDIFSAAVKPANSAVTAGTFGPGFALRLARAEAQSVGGNLTRVDDWLMLSLPLLTALQRPHSGTRNIS